MKNLSANDSITRRQTLYSETLSYTQLAAVSQACGLSQDEIKAAFARVETDPELNTQAWEAILNDHPVDWRVNPAPSAHRFKLCGYAIPLAPPSFLEGFVESGRKDRIDAALTKNKEIYFDKVMAISTHRESYETERNQIFLESDQKFEGTVKDHWIQLANKAIAKETEGGTYPYTGPSALKKAKEMYEQDTFNKFSEKRKTDLLRLAHEAFGPFAELNDMQMGAKIFTDYFLPALQKHEARMGLPRTAQSSIKGNKGPAL